MNLQPIIIEEADVDDKTDAEIKKNLCICFPLSSWRFSQSRVWRGNVPLYSVILTDGETVYAHLAVTDRTISIGQEQLHVAGVGNVFVLPAYRGNGGSDAILQKAMEQAAQRGFDLGLLFASDSVEKVYSRNGWVVVSERDFIAIEHGEEIVMPKECVEMYYPLDRQDFPEGKVELLGDSW